MRYSGDHVFTLKLRDIWLCKILKDNFWVKQDEVLLNALPPSEHTKDKELESLCLIYIPNCARRLWLRRRNCHKPSVNLEDEV